MLVYKTRIARNGFHKRLPCSQMEFRDKVTLDEYTKGRLESLWAQGKYHDINLIVRLSFFLTA